MNIEPTESDEKAKQSYYVRCEVVKKLIEKKTSFLEGKNGGDFYCVPIHKRHRSIYKTLILQATGPTRLDVKKIIEELLLRFLPKEAFKIPYALHTRDYCIEIKLSYVTEDLFSKYWQDAQKIITPNQQPDKQTDDSTKKIPIDAIKKIHNAYGIFVLVNKKSDNHIVFDYFDKDERDYACSVLSNYHFLFGPIGHNSLELIAELSEKDITELESNKEFSFGELRKKNQFKISTEMTDQINFVIWYLKTQNLPIKPPSPIKIEGGSSSTRFSVQTKNNEELLKTLNFLKDKIGIQFKIDQHTDTDFYLLENQAMEKTSTTEKNLPKILNKICSECGFPKNKNKKNTGAYVTIKIENDRNSAKIYVSGSDIDPNSESKIEKLKQRAAEECIVLEKSGKASFTASFDKTVSPDTLKVETKVEIEPSLLYQLLTPELQKLLRESLGIPDIVNVLSNAKTEAIKEYSEIYANNFPTMLFWKKRTHNYLILKYFFHLRT